LKIATELHAGDGADEGSRRVGGRIRHAGGSAVVIELGELDGDCEHRGKNRDHDDSASRRTALKCADREKTQRQI